MLHSQLQRGFTLIEMIVSLALFSIVITISVGALLVLIATNQQLQSEQSVMTNLSFALDSMTREIRTGYNYHCDSRPNLGAGPASTIFKDPEGLGTVSGTTLTADCSNGRTGGVDFHGISFFEGGESITGGAARRITYYHDASTGMIMRAVGDAAAESIVSTGIFINSAEFFVTGSRPLSAGGGSSRDQAAVTIFIEATESDDPTGKPYYLQTTITQRTLDI